MATTASVHLVAPPLLLHGECRHRLDKIKHRALQFPSRSQSCCRFLASSPRFTTVFGRATSEGELSVNQQRSKEQEEKEDAEKQLLQERMKSLAENMVLPANYLSQLPNDLQRDLKDAAFALSNGPLQRECGDVAGEILMQLSQAWEKGDTQATASAADTLQYALPSDSTMRTAIGKRMVAAGRCFAATGDYAEGELQKIAKALIAAGELLSASTIQQLAEKNPVPATRFYKFGELQVEVTAQKCYFGCLFALLFGSLSWGLTSSLQNISENSLQYANNNAFMLATSLRGTLLLLGYSCTVLSSFALVGLLGLALQLSSNEDKSL